MADKRWKQLPISTRMAKENGGYSYGGMLRGLKSEIPRLSGTMLPGTRPWVLWPSLIKSKQETKRKKGKTERRKGGRALTFMGHLSHQINRDRKRDSGYLEPGSGEGWEVVQWASTLKFFQNKKVLGSIYTAMKVHFTLLFHTLKVGKIWQSLCCMGFATINESLLKE